MTTATARPVRGTNVFRDAVKDAEKLSIQLRVMDGSMLTSVDIALLDGALRHLIDSVSKVVTVQLDPGDVFDLETEPLVPPTKPVIDVTVSMNHDVIDGLEVEGFFNRFDAGEERVRAFHAIACMDELAFNAQYIGHESRGTDLWIATGLEDVVMNALLIMTGKRLRPDSSQ